MIVTACRREVCLPVMQALVSFAVVGGEAAKLAKQTDKAMDEKRRKALSDMIAAAKPGAAAALPAAPAAGPPTTASLPRCACCTTLLRCQAGGPHSTVAGQPAKQALCCEERQFKSRMSLPHANWLRCACRAASGPPSQPVSVASTPRGSESGGLPVAPPAARPRPPRGAPRPRARPASHQQLPTIRLHFGPCSLAAAFHVLTTVTVRQPVTQLALRNAIFGGLLASCCLPADSKLFHCRL